MTPVIKELNSRREHFRTKVCVTGQHREMLDQVLALFDIKPDFDLEIMRHGQSLAESMSRTLVGLEGVLSDFRPDIVLVQGDTTSTLAASLASYFQRIDVGHIEAGLRTGRIYAPWPEEINRKATSTIAKWHFAPTERARDQLLKEGYEGQSIFVTGNTVVDALHLMIEEIDQNIDLRGSLDRKFDFLDQEKRLVLVTGHRRESFGRGFESICAALKEIANSFNDLQLIFPVHSNPNVRRPVQRMLADIDNVFLVEPVDYSSFIYLMKRASLIITDSGGVQEEAPSLNAPVIVTRDVTERPEAVDVGAVKLVGSRREAIVDESKKILSDSNVHHTMTKACNPYGDGNAAARIVNILLDSRSR